MNGITRTVNSNKKLKFVIATTKERKNRRKNDKDNITSIIKTFVFNSIITFINENIRCYFGEQRRILRKINRRYRYNAKVSEDLNKQVFKSKIRTLFYKSISQKYRKTRKNQNKLNIEYLERFSFFKKLFQIKYWKFYTYLFLYDKYEIINKCFSNEDEKTKEIKDKILMIKMKNLKDLQEKLTKNNDKQYIEKVENVAYKLEHKFRFKVFGRSNQSTKLTTEKSIKNIHHQNCKVNESELDFNIYLHNRNPYNINNFLNNNTDFSISDEEVKTKIINEIEDV